MKQKKRMIVFLAAMFVLAFCLIGNGSRVKAANNVRYYYQQLSGDARQIYDGMYNMYVQGIMKTGTQSYDLVGNGHLGEVQLAAYEGNYEALLKAFGAARDAFYADYPEIFYVDFSSLAIGVYEDGQGGYQAYLGVRDGKDSYFVEGFTGSQQVEEAQSAQEAKINEIAQGAGGASSVREKVIYAHNAVTENTSYRLEDNCSSGNGGHIRTAYGALVKQESLCEGYARAVKTVLDSMGINSVLVQGYYLDTDGSRNLHMWNYVQVDGKWYGLDATIDDGMENGDVSDVYLLADSTVMGQHHIPDGVMSGAGFRFTYPQLETFQPENPDSGAQPDNPDSGTGKPVNPDAETPQPGDGSQGEGTVPDTGNEDEEGYKVVFSQDGLVVGYKDGTGTEEDVGIFKVSYNGMGYQEAAKKGIYILSRFYQYMPGFGECVAGNWGYSDPTPFMMSQREDALIIPNGNSKYLEFAVTNIPPKGPLYGEDLSAEDLKNNWNFQGTESDFLVSTGKLENPKGNFVPSPFAVKLSPGNTGFLTSGKKYTVTAVFNEKLEEYDGQTVGYELNVKDGWSAAANCKIENFRWDGDRTVTFDFTPSEMFADNSARYDFQITGLRVGSQKVPDVFSYYSKRKISICAFRPQGYFWNVFGAPKLLEPGDLSYNGWQLSTGENLTDAVTNVVLVASKPELTVTTPDAGQTGEMIDKIEGTGAEVVASSTYNIDLLICNQSVVKTGDGVRISVGFPEGYGADTEGVEYKAYHFIKENGKIVGVEEINCVVTEYGLVIACKSFSPYAIAAVKADHDAVPEKSVLFLNAEGGEVVGDKIIELEKGQSSRTVTVQAKDGYCISGINVSGNELQVTNSKTMNIVLSYDNLPYDENIAEVRFTAEKPQQAAGEEPKPTETKEPVNAPEKESHSDSSSEDTESGRENNQESGQENNQESGQENNQGSSQENNQGSSQENSQGSGQKTEQKQTKAPETVKAPETSAAQQTPVRNQTAEKEKETSFVPVSDSRPSAADSSEEKEEAAQEIITEEADFTASAQEPSAGKEWGSVEGDRSDMGTEELEPDKTADISSLLNEDKIFWSILASISGIGVISIISIIIVKMRG